MPLITIKTLIHQDIEIVFDLARNIDLHSFSTITTKEIAVDGCTSGLIEKNEWVTWEGTHFGIRQRLTSKITEMEKPYFFVDEMTKGIFKKIYHLHTFKKIGKNTLMTDEFYFESPFSILGIAFNEMILTKYLKKFLINRNQIIKSVAEGNDWQLYI